MYHLMFYFMSSLVTWDVGILVLTILKTDVKYYILHQILNQKISGWYCAPSMFHNKLSYHLTWLNMFKKITTQKNESW